MSTSWRVCLSALVLGLVAADVAPARAADEGRVAIIAPLGVRLGDRVLRELSAAGFFPQLARPGAEGWEQAARDLPPHLDSGVAVLGEGRVVVFSRSPDGHPQIRRVLTPSRRDPLAPRRVALAVVEILRLRTPEPHPEGTSAAAAGASPQAPQTPTPAQVPEKKLVPTPAPVPVIAASGTAGTEDEDQDRRPPPQPQPWALGAATTVNLDSSRLAPTSHVQMTALFRLRHAVKPFVRVLWPLLGTRFLAGERLVRLWTGGASTGVEVPLRVGSRLEPFVGAEVGLRFVLTEADKDVGLVPGARAGVVAGVRYAVWPLVQLCFEGAAEWSRQVALEPGTGYERDAANARTARLSLGVLFEY